MMTYKGYQGLVHFDDEAEIFHGEVMGLRDVVTFQGRTVDELKTAFHESIEDYLEFCASRGEEPDKPFSGRFVLRVDPSLHRRLAELSVEHGESLNNWIISRLESFVGPSKERVSVKKGGSTPIKEPGLDERHRDKSGLVERHRDKDGRIDQKRGDTLNKNLPTPIEGFSPNARLDTIRKETGETSERAIREAAKDRKP